MATFTKQVIDPDAHVVETERVWDYLDGVDKKYRPTLTTSPHNPQRQIWVLGGENLGNKFPSPDEQQAAEHLKRFGREVATPMEARELSDVKQRLAHMDELGIGTDYGHGDTSSELNAIARFKAMDHLTPEVTRKILFDNPKRFYGI